PWIRLRCWSWRGRSWSFRRRRRCGDHSRDGWRGPRSLGSGLKCWRFGGLRNGRNLSEARTGYGKQHNRSMQGVNGGHDATRCQIAGQFASTPGSVPNLALQIRTLPAYAAPRKVSAELDIARDLVVRITMLRHMTLPQPMKNFLRVFV